MKTEHNSAAALMTALCLRTSPLLSARTPDDTAVPGEITRRNNAPCPEKISPAGGKTFLKRALKSSRDTKNIQPILPLSKPK